MTRTLTQQIAARLEELVTYERNHGRYRAWEACLIKALEEAGVEIVSKAPLLERVAPTGRRRSA